MSIRANIVKGNIIKILEANVGKMETELKQWGAKLDKLVANVEAAGTEVKLDYRKSVEDLRSTYRLTQSRFDEFKAAGVAKWEIFKTGVETAWDDLETSFKELTKHSHEEANIPIPWGKAPERARGMVACGGSRVG